MVVDIKLDPNDPQAIALLKETIADRLEATAQKLGLTQEQRDKIKATYSGFAANYAAQARSAQGAAKRGAQGDGGRPHS